MSEILAPVSIGELIDKITILRIKSVRITDAGKLANIGRELAALEQVCTRGNIDSRAPLAGDLQRVNDQLWDIEDAIREKERAKAFDAEFIRLAREVYITNDKRFSIKSAINRQMGSTLAEEKSYQPY